MKGAFIFAAAALACAGVATAHTTTICFDDSNAAGVAISVHTYHTNNANGATLHVKDTNNVRTNYVLNNFQFGGLPSGPSVTCQKQGLSGGSDSTFYTAVVPFSCTAGEILYLWTSSVVSTVLFMRESQAVKFTCPAGGIGSSAFPGDFTAECNAANPPDLSATANGAGAADVEEAPACSGLTDNTYDGAPVPHASCPNTYSFTRHFSFTETGCPNPETYDDNQLITVQDTTAPTFSSVPSDIVVNCGTDITDPANTGGSATATDSCQGAITPTYSDHTPAGQSVCTGQVTSRTWTASDGCGNSVSHVQTITVQSGTPPTITAPADATYECGSEDTSVSANGEAAVGGGCGAITLTYVDSTANGCGNSYVITRTWTATDNCGTTASAAQTITVQDTTAPQMFNLPAGDMTVECDSVPAAPTVTATDACGTPTVNYFEERADGNCPHNYVLTRTWIAFDECQNSASFVQKITVQDTTAPTQDATTELCVLPKHGSQKNRYACFTDVTKNQAGSFATFSDNCGATTIDSVTCTSTRPAKSGSSSGKSSKSGSGKSSSGKSSSGKSNRRALSSDTLTPCSASSGSSSSGSSGSRRLRVLKGKKGSKSASGKSSKSGSSGNKKPADGFDIYFGYKEKPDCIYYPQHDMVCVHAKVQGNEKQGRTYTVGFTGTDECGNTASGSRDIWVGKNKKQAAAKGYSEDDCVAPTHKMKCGDGDALFAGAPAPAARNADEAEDAPVDLKAPASPAAPAAPQAEASDATLASVAIIGGGAVVAAALVVVGLRYARRSSGSASKQVVTLPGAASATTGTEEAVSVEATPREAW